MGTLWSVRFETAALVGRWLFAPPFPPLSIVSIAGVSHRGAERRLWGDNGGYIRQLRRQLCLCGFAEATLRRSLPGIAIGPSGKARTE